MRSMTRPLGLSAAFLLVTAPAYAGMPMTPSVAAPFGAPVDDEPVFYHVLFDQLEGRLAKESGFRWEGEGWAGTDMNRVVLKTQGAVAQNILSDGDQELLYARPISTYFNMQGGLRYDLDSRPGRGWAAFGIEGLAPQFFHVAATGYLSDKGHAAIKLEGNYDLLITQTLVLQPQIEMDFYSKDDSKRQIGTGLADLDTGLRLRYEITRKFAPYIGVTYENKFGKTADFARATSERTSNLRFSIGLRAWL